MQGHGFIFFGRIALALGILLLLLNMKVRSDVRGLHPEIHSEAEMEEHMNLDKNMYITSKEIQWALLIGGAGMIVL